MHIRFTQLLLATALLCSWPLHAQSVKVDVNLNIKHSVNGVSDFGRERHITVHSTPTDVDWKGEEKKLDYLINDLDVYFGRDNGSATWKFNATEEDPNRKNHPDTVWMENFAGWLKSEYEKNSLVKQYENKGAMIMGTNPHPTYPTYSWYTNGSTWTGWQPHTVETSAEWVEHYLDYSFRKNEGENGEPLPKYWEVVNEIDMGLMTGQLNFSSYEKVWQYHNLVREGLRKRMGKYAPKVGGMTWGQHDFSSPDGLGRISVDKAVNDYGLNPDAVATSLEPYYKDNWFQWDVLFQGFMDACPDMDFWSIHLYDWPQAKNSIVRSGPVVEASLDMMEWYDNYKFGAPKELIVSEFGSVSGYLDEVSPKRRAWENLRPFNAMFLQFLERPSHIRLTMPFCPIKAEWGDVKDANGNVIKRYPSTLLDKDEHGDWQWTDFELWYEQWSKVDGTRVETKSTDRDIQVDAYANGNHVYVIMNSLQQEATTVDLNIFGHPNNTVQSVEMRNLYLDESLGTDGEAVYDVRTFQTTPGSVSLKGDATIILDYTFANPVSITDEVKEIKYMCERMGEGTTPTGGPVFRKEVAGRQKLTAHVNNVVIPSGATEAVLRIGGRFWDSGVIPLSITLNGHALVTNPNRKPELNPDWRGENNPGRNYWFGVYELDVPKAYLQENNTIECSVANTAFYTSVMLQLFDFSTAPKRSANGDKITLTGINLPTSIDLMQHQTKSLKASFIPENATNTKLSWKSSDVTVASVNEFGELTAEASSGTATITASSDDGGHVATTIVNAIPYAAVPVTNIHINEGSTVDLEYYVTTPLHLTISPSDATEQHVIWTSGDETIATVDATTGKVTGIQIGKTTTVSAKVIDANNGNKVYQTSIDVTVGIAGEETIFTAALPDELIGNDEYALTIPANLNGSRNITLELLQGSTVIATETKSVTKVGRTMVPIVLKLPSVPSPGTNYSFKTILSDGENQIYEGTAPLEIKDIIHTESITINDWLRKVQVGKTLPITAQVLPEDAFDVTVNWSSSNESIAIVNAQGVVTGVSAGSTIITATTHEGGLSAQVTITVQNGKVQMEPTQLSIKEKVSAFPNTTYTYALNIEPEWTTEKEVSWTSSNPSIAAVNANGVVTAGPIEGDVLITASSVSKPSVFATSQLSVSNTIYIEAEDFDVQGGPQADIAKNSVGINNVQTGDYVEYQLNIPKSGEYAASFLVGTKSTDGRIELLVDGVSKGSKPVPTGDWDTFVRVNLDQKFTISEGQHTLRVLASGSEQWQWNMEHFELVFQGSNDVEGVLLLQDTLTMGLTQTRTLEASVYPASASNKDVSWSSSNESIATVTNGRVTAVSTGTSTITVTTQEGAFTDECRVTVQTDPVYVLVSKITIEPTSVGLAIGGTQQLTPAVLPEKADNKTVSWESSDTRVATVSANGVVTGHQTGTAFITARSTDGSAVGYSIPVNVADILVLEAEDLVATGGTYADGKNNNINVVAGLGVNYVNNGDWAEYTLTVPESGTYQITYYISCPMENGNISVFVNDVQQSTDFIPDNGLTSNEWETYIPIVASSPAVLTAGTHTFKIAASGSNWQWNLDKIEFLKVGSGSQIAVSGVRLDKTSARVEIGKTVSLSATVMPENASNQKVFWESSSPLIATVVDGIITGLSVGEVTITARTQDGNYSQSSKITVENAVSVQGPNSDSMSMYPNPAHDMVIIDGLSEKSMIVIYNLNGKMYHFFESNQWKEQINIANYPQGVYLVKVISEGNTKKFKLVKK